VPQRLLVSLPALASLLEPGLVPLVVAGLVAFQDRLHVLPGVLALFQQRDQDLPVESSTALEAKELQYAAGARERPPVRPDLREHVVEPDEMPVPLPGHFALVLDRLNRLEQPLQGTDRHVVAEMLGDVGEVHHRPVRDTAEDVRGVVTTLEVFVIGKPEALVLEVVGDAPGPDRVLVGVLRQLLSEVDLVADLGDPPGT